MSTEQKTPETETYKTPLIIPSNSITLETFEGICIRIIIKSPLGGQHQFFTKEDAREFVIRSHMPTEEEKHILQVIEGVVMYEEVTGILKSFRIILECLDDKKMGFHFRR